MSVILNFEEEKIFRHWFQTHLMPMDDSLKYIRTAYEAGVEAERKRAKEAAAEEEAERRDRAIYS